MSPRERYGNGYNEPEPAPEQIAEPLSAIESALCYVECGPDAAHGLRVHRPKAGALAARLAAIPANPDVGPTVFQWLIERSQPEGQVPTVWYRHFPTEGWTTDAMAASMFPTKADAEAFIEKNGIVPGRAVEHGFIPATPDVGLDVDALTAAVFEADRPGDWPTWEDYIGAFGTPGIPPWRRKAKRLADAYAARLSTEPSHE